MNKRTRACPRRWARASWTDAFQAAVTRRTVVSRLAVLAIVLAGAVIVVAPASAATCNGATWSTLNREGLTPPVIAAHGGSSPSAVVSAVVASCKGGLAADRVAARVLHDNSYDAPFVAGVLHDDFGDDATGAAQALQTAGYSATEVAAGVQGAYLLGAADAAAI